MASYDSYIAGDLQNYEVTDEMVQANIASLDKII